MDISQQREALHRGWGAALRAGPQQMCSDQPYQADSDDSGHDMVWLDLSARYSDQPYQADSDGSGHDMVWLDLSARY